MNNPKINQGERRPLNTIIEEEILSSNNQQSHDYIPEYIKKFA